jgi:hypothetical protein
MDDNNFNSNSSTSYLGFSPNNFYYVNAESRGTQYSPDSSCNDVFNNVGVFNNLNCEHSKFQDNSFNCLKKEMCINKKLAQSLTLEYSNRGSDIDYLDNKTSYNIYLIKITNIIIGISAILYFMYKNKSKNLILK